MNTSTVILVFMVSILLSEVHGEQEAEPVGFTKEGLLELNDILVQMNISKPDEDRINRDVKTLIQEALHDLKEHAERTSGADEPELCLITIKALEDELIKINETENGGQDTTTASSETLTTTSYFSTTTSTTEAATTETPTSTSDSPTTSSDTSDIPTTTSTTSGTTTSDTLNMID